MSRQSDARWARRHRIVEGLKCEMMRLYDDCQNQQWSHEMLLEQRRIRVLGTDAYKRLPQHYHAEIDGVDWARMRQLWQVVVFSYEIDGKRLAIDSTEYHYVAPQRVCEQFGHTGAYMYRLSPNNLFTTSIGEKTCTSTQDSTAAAAAK